MDFGEILNRWDKRQGAPYPDKDEAQTQAGERQSNKALPIDARLDLHGMTREEAEAALSDFFYEAERMQYRKVLIIHGKGLHSDGSPVLDRLVRLWLETCPQAGQRGYACASNGGRGATWVVIKKNVSARGK